MVDEALRTAGLRGTDHPVLRAALEIAADGGLVLAGVVPAARSWRAAVVEIALAAGARVGRPVLAELTVDETPAAVDHAVQVHMRPLEDDAFSVRVFGRPAGTGQPWTAHAEGRVTAGLPAVPAEWAQPWPPAGATQDGARWRRGDELFTETTGTGDAAGFAVHPDLLDTVMRELPAADDLRGASVHAAGADAVRIRIASTESGHTVTAVDHSGQLVFHVDTLGKRTGALVRRIAGLDPDAGRRLVLRAVAGHVAAVLPDKCGDGVPMDKPLNDVGFDSLNSVELSNLLSTETGLRLTATVVFDHPTLTALAGHLYTAIAPRPRSALDEARAALDRLETLMCHSEGARDAVAALVHETLARLGARAPTDAAARIDSASDEEIFALIDNR